ncbi:hypothetical protein [Virgisporangium aliadipatigenens]|nr:hypothetical protein [Virgisporangium aliadipatigenens]
MLDRLGLTDLQERLYRSLLDEPSSVDALARRLAVTPADVTNAAETLQDHGLITLDDGFARAAPPDLAIDSLILHRMHTLQEARVELRRWAEQHTSIRISEPGLQAVVGGPAILRAFERFQRSTRTEMLGFDRPPYAAKQYDNPIQHELLSRGVVYRIVYDRRALEQPDAATKIGRLVALGEQARAALDVPCKLAVSDRRSALLSFPRPGAGGEPWALQVQGDAWVEVLVALFTQVWERASPLRLAPAGDAVEDLDRWAVPTPMDRRVLSLLMTGLPDKAVASQLGMSLRTVQRRLRQLMDVTGSATRMQLGWYVAKNDWL